jgi:hypothetical protein
MEQTKVIGKIHIPDDYNSKCTCDDCGRVLNDNYGDPRVQVVIYNNDGSTSQKWICELCVDEIFGVG